MTTVKIVLRKEKKKKDNTYPIAIRITKDRKPRYIHTGQSVLQKHWDDKERRIKKSHPNSKRLNNLLLKKLAEANDIMIEAETLNDQVSSHDIKKKVTNKIDRLSFFAFATQKIEEKYNSHVYVVARSQRSILNNIAEFIQLNDRLPVEVNKQAIKERRAKRISTSQKKGYSFLAELKKLKEANQNIVFEDIHQGFIHRFKAFCVTYLDMKLSLIHI